MPFCWFADVLAWPSPRCARRIPPPLELTAEQDHKLMMEQLGITAHPPGRQRPRSERAERG